MVTEIMSCPRCQGFVFFEFLYTNSGKLFMQKCCNCGWFLEVQSSDPDFVTPNPDPMPAQGKNTGKPHHISSRQGGRGPGINGRKRREMTSW